jgi:uncharacterized protein involved in exopolysaccharide biosynthesis
MKVPFVDLKSQPANLRAEINGAIQDVIDAAAFAAASIQGGQSLQPNISSERAILAGIKSRVEALRARMNNLLARVKTISQVAPGIEELERKAEVEETNYKHSESSLEKARIDETLDPSRMPNISIVQTPTSAAKVKRNSGELCSVSQAVA